MGVPGEPGDKGPIGDKGRPGRSGTVPWRYVASGMSTQRQKFFSSFMDRLN